MMASVVAELEGTLLKDPDPFAYFMLIAFEASGPIRFTILLFFWPVIRLLDLLGQRNAGLRLTIFVSVAGLRISDIEYVGRAILPKYYMGDLDMGAWRVFSRYGKKVVVTKTPRLMVERFVKNHLRADHVIGTELAVNRFGYATGLVEDVGSLPAQVFKLVGDDDDQPSFVFRRFTYIDHIPFMSQCNMQRLILSGEECNESMPPTSKTVSLDEENADIIPVPVIFHDGRLAKKPKPCTALLILLWLPLGVIIALLRIVAILSVPMFVVPFQLLLVGIYVKVKGNVPTVQRNSSSGGGVVFACNHRTGADPVVISHVLGRKTPAVTYGIARMTEKLSPIPTIGLSRVRDVDAAKIKRELEKGDLVICPEGDICREPFVLRFSSLFAELADHIIPVAINHNPVLFHGRQVRRSRVTGMFYFFMNPIIIYEMTFLDKVEVDTTTSSSGDRKSPHQVANHIQALIASTLGFTSTTLTRKDMHEILDLN